MQEVGGASAARLQTKIVMSAERYIKVFALQQGIGRAAGTWRLREGAKTQEKHTGGFKREKIKGARYFPGRCASITVLRC